MMASDLISIIMPAYNAERHISYAIDSIINQSYNNWEFLICDDASTDSTYRIIKAYAFKDSRIRVYKNEKNIGSLRTRNDLFKKVNGKFIALQDADDVSNQDRIEKQYNAFLVENNIALCGTWANYYLNNDLIKKKKGAQSFEELSKKHPRSNQFCSASIMFLSSVLKVIEPYRDYFQNIGNYDYDFTLRVIEKYRAVNLPEFLYNVNVLPNSNSKRIGNPLKFESQKLVYFYHIERIKYGRDSLQNKDSIKVDEIESKLIRPYLLDKFLINDKQINLYLQNKLYWTALKFSFSLVIYRRNKLAALKLLFYSIKSVFFEYSLPN